MATRSTKDYVWDTPKGLYNIINLSTGFCVSAPASSNPGDIVTANASNASPDDPDATTVKIAVATDHRFYSIQSMASGLYFAPGIDQNGNRCVVFQTEEYPSWVVPWSTEYARWFISDLGSEPFYSWDCNTSSKHPDLNFPVALVLSDSIQDAHWTLTRVESDPQPLAPEPLGPYIIQSYGANTGRCAYVPKCSQVGAALMMADAPSGGADRNEFRFDVIKFPGPSQSLQVKSTSTGLYLVPGVDDNGVACVKLDENPATSQWTLNPDGPTIWQIVVADQDQCWTGGEAGTEVKLQVQSTHQGSHTWQLLLA